MKYKLNKIYNEECLQAMKQIPDNYFDSVITSPPYDNLRDYNNENFIWNEEVWRPIIKELYRITKEGGVIVWIVNDATINGSETGTSFKQALYFKEVGFNLHDTMIWQKGTSPFQHKTRYISCFEYMFILSKGNPKTHNLIADRLNKYYGTKIHGTERQKDGSTKKLSNIQKSKTVNKYGIRTNIWDIFPNKHNLTNHSAVFPEELIIDNIKSWTNKNDIILDPFMGSGTTAIACKKLNRKFIGFELDEKYYDETTQRILKFDRQKNMFDLFD